MTSSQKEKDKKKREFHKLINRAKGLYSFHQLKTYRDALREIGVVNGRVEQYCPNPDDNIDFPKLADIFDRIERDYHASLETPVVQGVKPEESLEPIYNNHIQSLFNDWIYIQQHKPKPKPKTLEEEYGIELPAHNPKQKAKLFKPQLRSAIEIYKAFTKEDPDKWNKLNGLDRTVAALLIGQAGHGKTFVLGQIIRWLHDSGYLKSLGAITPWPVFYVTKASVVEQSERVLKNFFGLDVRGSEVLVTNYDSLRAGFGEMFIDEETKVQDGVAYTIYKWKPLIRPILFILDECQALKNLDSKQSQLFQRLNDIRDGMPLLQIFSSATPYTRVIEAKTFAVATKIHYTFGLQIGKQLDNKHWVNFASAIADPAKPIEYSPAAVNRLTARLEPFIFRIKGLKPKYHAKNNVELIKFRTAEEQEEYDNAWEEYQEQKAKIEARSNQNSYFCVLAQLTIFRQKAELIRAAEIAARSDFIVRSGKAAAFACNFKTTIAKVVKILHEEYGYSRDKISLIWGGSAGYRGKEDLYTNEEIAQILMDAAYGKEVPKKVLREVAEQIRASAAGLIDIPKELELGNQSLKQRQIEIDRYQIGKSLIAGYTFKAGGVGLSLHHTDEYTEFKCRRTEAGWPIDEDIPLVPTRPREGILAPTYSAIELVQGLGRLPRLTSLSDTIQTLLFYSGTIESQVAAIVAAKLKCLKEVVQQRESWTDLFTAGKHEPLSVEGREIQQLEEGDEVDLSGIEENENE